MRSASASKVFLDTAKRHWWRWRSTPVLQWYWSDRQEKGARSSTVKIFGEAVENLTGSGEYHWMAGNFLKYGTAESKFGSLTPGDLPVDSHELIALCAPRLTFISYGIP
jgi:hypothetical protein